jgi:glycine cleavage system H lipoate-binding protein
VFPGIYEFNWDLGHIIFLGAFYTVLLIVFSTIVIATVRAIRDVKRGHVDAVRWHADFEDLPEVARRCRHELTGEVAHRACHNCFDCSHCEAHPKFVAAAQAQGLMAARPCKLPVAGFELPDDRLYHRGHTWVRDEGDGTLTIGLDDLASRLTGVPDDLTLPEPGARLVTNGIAWRARKNGVEARVLAPVDGEVVEIGGPSAGWYLKVKPAEGASLAHLLEPREARAWLLREFDRLQLAMGGAEMAPTLADGGVPIDDMSTVITKETLDQLCAMVFLEP